MKKKAEKQAEKKEHLSGITLDLAQRIYDKAVERATERKKEAFQKVLEVLRLEYVNLDEQAGKDILASIIADGVDERLIRAEIIRMNTAIAFLAKTKRLLKAEFLNCLF